MCVARQAQITQNNKFAVSLQYLNKKVVSNEVNFLCADKNESLLQIDRMILMGMVTHSQSPYKVILQGGTIIIDWHDQAFSKYSK